MTCAHPYGHTLKAYRKKPRQSAAVLFAARQASLEQLIRKQADVIRDQAVRIRELNARIAEQARPAKQEK